MSSSNISPSTSPSDLDELDYRSRKLNKLLKKNANKADRRKQLLNTVRDRAWVLEDEVNLLEKQTKDIKEKLQSKSFRRTLLVYGAFLSSLALIGFGVNHVVQHSSDDNSNMDDLTPT